MARSNLTEEERQKIRDSLKATRERRQNQSIKVIELKLFGSTKRAECLEQASVETLASAALELSDASKLSRRNENEDSSL